MSGGLEHGFRNHFKLDSGRWKFVERLAPNVAEFIGGGFESIHRLSKKVLPPKGTTWARIADKLLRKALGMPVEEPPEALNLRRAGRCTTTARGRPA